jgi:sec-independent protein translocase protein TatA
VGIPELIVILVIVLIVFGPKRLPMLGRQLGSGMREFKDSITGKSRDDAEDGGGEGEAAASPELTRGRQADPLDPEPDATRAPGGGRDESATRSGR